jgi:tetratricopeptide (TPR) repeat protein
MRTGRAISVAACCLALLAGGACTREEPVSQASPSVAGAAVDLGKLIDTGIAAAKEGRFDDAKASFEQVLQADPGNKFAWFNLGFLAQSRGDNGQAASDYDKALASDPSYTPALYNKAILAEADHPETAIELYQKILDINARAATALVRLGALLDKKGDKDGARSAFTRAAQLDPTLAESVPPSYRDNDPSPAPAD